MSMLRLLRAAACSLALSAWAFPARAQTQPPKPAPHESEDPDVEEARRLIKQGRDLWDAGRYEDAIVAYERSYKKKRHAQTTYNIGRCERKLHHNTRARTMFKAALAENAEHGSGE